VQEKSNQQNKGKGPSDFPGEITGIVGVRKEEFCHRRGGCRSRT